MDTFARNLTSISALPRWSIAVVAALAIGCQSPTEPIYVEEVGFIGWNAEPFDVLVLPPSAAAGADFTITVTSVGDGCSAPARTDVRYESNVAIVTPYDNQVVWLPPNWGCPDILLTHVHVATLRFTTPGVAQVRVEGRRYPGLEPAAVTGTLTIE